MSTPGPRRAGGGSPGARTPGDGRRRRPAVLDFVAGSGRARASLFEIAPRTGGLSIPVNFGKALVTYQGLSATATSGGAQAPGTEQRRRRLRQAPASRAAEGGGAGPARPGGGSGPPTSFPFVSTLIGLDRATRTPRRAGQMDQGSFPEGSPISGAFQHQQVSADAAPSGRAITTGGRMAFGPLVEIVNGRTEAHAGVIDGKARGWPRPSPPWTG